MLTAEKAKYIKLAVIAGAVIILDQITKVIITSTMDLNHSVSVIPGFFSIAYILNPGGAFGFLADQNSIIRAIVFIAVSFFAVCLIFYFYKETPDTHPYLSTGFAMIFGGAIGNMIDRLRLGEVIDFLVFYIPVIPLRIFNPWPAFNVADSAISIGMTIFICHIVFKKMPVHTT